MTSPSPPKIEWIPRKEKDYWRKYHSPAILERSDALRKEYEILSTGVKIHIDAYERPEPDAPVLQFNHGGGGYSRLFIPLALTLYDSGYTTIFPDQRGQGLSEGDRGDFTIGQFMENIVDVARWASSKYVGSLFMAGGSLGGALTYYAAAAKAPVCAIICHNLYNFGDPRDTLAMSRFPFVNRMPGAPTLIASVIRWIAQVFPWIKVPFILLGRFEKMVDARVQGFYDLWRRDPYPIKAVSLRYIVSTFSTPPALPFQRSPVPILVINQSRDRMVAPAVTKRNYDLLAEPKQYAEIDYGHWAMGGTFEEEWSCIVQEFLRKYHK